MNHLNSRRVHFDIPMDDESESQVPSSNAGDKSNMMYFGIGPPPVLPGTDTPAGPAAPPYQLNFRFEPEQPTSPVMQPLFNFGFHADTELSPSHPAAAPRADMAVVPSTPPYRLNFGFDPHESTLPALQPAFNFGFDAGMEISPTPPRAGSSFLDFGWNTSVTRDVPVTPVTKPFNFGMDLDLTPQWSATPPAILTPPPPTPRPAFNFGWNLSPTPSPGPPLHVGYDITNTPFQFNCQVPPAKVGVWQPVLVKEAVPTHTPPASHLNMAYTPKALPNVEFAVPKKSMLSSSSDTFEPRPSFLSVVGDAEQVVRNIVEWLQGDEFDKLAQLMLGSIVNPTDDVRDPKPTKVLDSNWVILSVFCESRDKLTQIFEDLIHLHHMAAVQARVVPMVASLSTQVQKVEGKSRGTE
ncbi:uncharacterized protein F5147DRAFT_781535 [Suillus discolor]|uniref:Uncharacterized protein n=1 Tax=Suillus discolor TaxID=1912936 RepID=A0A9P7ESH4_9AGAM|nr:uncharacterized protein F5147DRAFT_781535 [Suillus discolor]KAG2086760.1 hypothetical protein F5147DRAFT_781535 [Suillus discolor]